MMEENLMKGPGESELKLYLQSKHDTKTSKIVGAESLSRFVTGEGSVVMPSEYIDEFEQTGKIIELDFCMLELVLKFLQESKKQKNKLVPVSVNFSKKTLTDDGVLERIRTLVENYDVSPEFLEIEITELHAFHDYERAKEVIDGIREIGCSVSIDDYGKNSSAFSIIRRVDIDTLKIDRSIIVESEFSEKTYIIFDSVVQLAKKLKLTVVAEGVETDEQLTIAKKVGCDAIQGWYFSKAVPVDEFKNSLKLNV